MGKFNDIDLENWRESDVNTDSLWLIGERAKTGKHRSVYHGNFHSPDSVSTSEPIYETGRRCFGALYGERDNAI